MKLLTSLFVSCCLIFILSSCTSKAPVGSGEEVQALVPVSSIAVLPVQVMGEKDGGIPGTADEALQNGAMFGDLVLGEELKKNSKVKLVSQARMDDLGYGVKGGLQATVAAMGKELGCDAVLVTVLRRYKQRQGGEYSVESPASTSFKMTLFSTTDQRALWVADFNETQESLMENLFSFGKAQSRGFKWVTVEDLLSQGMRERLAECPYF